MMDAAQRAPIRRWFYAVCLAMSSVELHVHHTAIRDAMGAGGFVRARIRIRATRLDSCREPVAPIFDNQLRPCTMWPSDKRRDTGYLRLVVRRLGYVRTTQPMRATAVLPPTTRPGEPAPPAVDAKTTGLCFDMTAEMRVGFGSVYLTAGVLARSARRRRGQHLRGIGGGAALWRLYRRLVSYDSH